MYRESANYLSEFGSLDPGFIYMPGFVALLAWVKDLGGDLLAQKLLGVAFGGIGAAGLFVLSSAACWTSKPDGSSGSPDGAARAGGGSARARTRRLATLIYALWPAGVAMSSVVGTDMPAAALLAVALALLVALAPRRPWHGGGGVRRRHGAGGLGARGGAAAVGAGARLLAGAPDKPLRALALTARRRRRDAGGAAAVGHPARAPERPALLHRRPRRHHRAHRRQPELRGDVHARAQPHVQGRHRAQRARRAAPRDRSRRVRHRARVDSRSSRATRWGWR